MKPLHNLPAGEANREPAAPSMGTDWKVEMEAFMSVSQVVLSSSLPRERKIQIMLDMCQAWRKWPVPTDASDPARDASPEVNENA